MMYTLYNSRKLKTCFVITLMHENWMSNFLNFTIALQTKFLRIYIYIRISSRKSLVPAYTNETKKNQLFRLCDMKKFSNFKFVQLKSKKKNC